MLGARDKLCICSLKNLTVENICAAASAGLHETKLRSASIVEGRGLSHIADPDLTIGSGVQEH